MEALRCLKRYISREVYTLLRNQNRQINSTQIMTLLLEGRPGLAVSDGKLPAKTESTWSYAEHVS